MCFETTVGGKLKRQSSTTVADRRLYRMLRKEIAAAGCLRPARLASSIRMILVLAAYFGAYVALLQSPDWGVRVVLLLLLGITGVQSSFIGHEVGHHAVTRNRQATRFLGYVFMTFVTGYAQTHYMQNHKRHHAHPNDVERDPDIQGAGVLSFYPASADAKTGPAKLVTAWQEYLIWFLLTLQAFSLKIRGLKLIFGRIRSYPAEKLTLVLHFILWFGVPAVTVGIGDAVLNYGLITLLVGVYLGGVILVNHVGMPVKRPDESMPSFHQTLATTRDLGSSRVDDIVFGGTNNHVEHHLFPSIPMHRLRVAREITRRFCKQHNVAYREMNWAKSMREVFIYLENISKQARVSGKIASLEI